MKQILEKDRSLIQCPSCPKQFFKSNKFNRHFNQSHLDIRNFICAICNKTFHRKSHLSRHQLSHNSLRDHKCTIAGCYMQFKHKHHLKRHIKCVHEQGYKCSCGQSFRKKATLNNHKRKCMSQVKEQKREEQKVLVCMRNECLLSFASVSNLRRHELVHKQA